jgi:Flp pilus assembly protein TadG
VSQTPERQRGSTLLLFPAALLIMVALAAITVDSAIAFLAQRELANATAAAANDAATRGLSDEAFYERDSLELSSDAVEDVAVARVLQLVSGHRHHDLAVRAVATAPAAGCSSWTVQVTASSRVEEIFGRAMPGADGQVAVRAESTASPRQRSGSC